MGDHQSSSLSSPTKPISSFLGSPRFFNGISLTLTKSQTDPESSPTFIIETKQFSNFSKNPFGFTKNPTKPTNISREIKHPYENFDSDNGIALALALSRENPTDKTLSLNKSQTDPESSPTSPLETKQFSNFNSNPIEFTKNPTKPTNIPQEIKHPSENFDSETGIALVLVLVQENPIHKIPNPNSINRKIQFWSKLKIQIPSHSQSDPTPNVSPESPGDFGIKTRNLQFSGAPTPNGSGSPRTPMSSLSLREMELSEEYTRVISHGSNPKITHIYDDCVLESPLLKEEALCEEP